MKKKYVRMFCVATVVLVGALLSYTPDLWGSPHGGRRRTLSRYSRTAALNAGRDLDTTLPAGLIDVSRDSTGMQHVQGMVVTDPTNPQRALCFFYDTRAYYTLGASVTNDGGQTWTLSGMPPAPPQIDENIPGGGGTTMIADPTCSVNTQGEFFVAGDGPDPATQGQSLQVYVAVSADHGNTFASQANVFTVEAGSNGDALDHQSNCADSSGTTQNDYEAVASFITNNSLNPPVQSGDILFSTSSNLGGSWSPPSKVNTDDTTSENSVTSNSTPDTRVDSHGNVYVDWINLNFGSNPNGNLTVMVDHAAQPSDGGFGPNVTVATLYADGSIFDGFLGDVRMGTFNQVAVDNSNTATNGNVYEAWTDQVSALGGTTSPFKLFVSRSIDGGNTWATAQRVDTSYDIQIANSDHQCEPTVGVNPITGQVLFTYYSTRFNPAERGGPNTAIQAPQNETDSQTPLFDLLAVIGTPNNSGGLNFQGPYRITPTSIDTLEAQNEGFLEFAPALGDYNGIAFHNVSNGVNSIVVFATTDESAHIVEAAVPPFDGTATSNEVSGGTLEVTSSANAPAGGGIVATINWGDASAVSSGVDVTHDYAAGTYTPTVTVSDASTAFHTITLPQFTSNGTFTDGGSAGSSVVKSANTLVPLPMGSALNARPTGPAGLPVNNNSPSGSGGSGGSGGDSGGSNGNGSSNSGGGFGNNNSGSSGGGGGGGCFIATAAYGSYWEPHVMTLRRFRDDCLMTNAPGRAFVFAYYRYSPPIADWIRERAWARFGVRLCLTPGVFLLEHGPLGMMMISLLAVALWKRRRTCRA